MRDAIAGVDDYAAAEAWWGGQEAMGQFTRKREVVEFWKAKELWSGRPGGKGVEAEGGEEREKAYPARREPAPLVWQRTRRRSCTSRT